jgi:hypothetical protein
VATKLVLCLGVIAIGIPFVDRHIQRAVASVPVALLISVSAAHVLVLGAATVLSVYEPWGKASFGQQKVVRSSRGSGQETAGVQR